ncbi:MAG: hypothetical protein HUJ76_03790 [Parasporobacterium sp.]|nr:hypothetical protein [Parasporobacterium sp.]
MKCYKCGSFLYDGEFCSTCGADVTLYREIVLKSNDLYNSALEYARDRNLSKAIEHLRLSIRLFKGNINAHNLLGLVYFETGEYTLGFAHWVISKNLQPENNLASVFLDQVQEDKPYFDALNAGIIKYNKAISYVEQGSYDLAEIQLKKLLNDGAIHMVTAYQLYALLKIRKKKYAAARKILTRAAAVDAGNPTTIAFSTFVSSQMRDEEKDLTAGELRAKRQKDKNADDELHSPLSGDDVIIPKSSYREYNPTTMAVIQILLGFIVGAALIFFIVVPAKTNAVRNEASLVQAELEDRITQLTKEKEALTTTAPKAEEDNKAADAGSKDAGKASEEDLKLLDEAYAAYEENDVLTCGNKLYEIKNPEAFEGENKEKYDEISYAKDVVPDMWFADAKTLYDSYEFETALKEFTRVYEVANTTGESLYYMGACNYNLGNFEEAARRFNEYIETFPEGDHAGECYYLLSEMEG